MGVCGFDLGWLASGGVGFLVFDFVTCCGCIVGYLRPSVGLHNVGSCLWGLIFLLGFWGFRVC